MLNENADIKENAILKLSYDLLALLLKDHTTNKNIIWATDNYKEKGPGYQFNDNINVRNITGYNGNTIRPRIAKSKKEQERRIKNNGEVFTPSWICNVQNNLIDNVWFGKKNVFNVELENSWKTRKAKIKFPTKTNKSFLDYIKDIRLEITCGEAPYLVNRYDNVTGEIIKVENRIGLLDRKLRIINENTKDEKEWQELAKLAYKSIYGYEYQGDNLLIARENLLVTYIDNYLYKFHKEPSLENLLVVAEIISWNIWQMDGLKFVIPDSCQNEDIVNYSIFGEEIIEQKCIGCIKNDYRLHNGIYCKIMNWETNRKIRYISLLNRSKKAKK